MKKNNIIVWGITITIFIVSIVLWANFLTSFFLAISIPILKKLWQNKNTINIIIWSLIMAVDLFLLFLLVIPTKAYNVNIKGFYQKQQNYLKIYMKDPPSRTKYMALFIWRKNNLGEIERTMIRLSDYTWWKIPVYQNDKIYFIWRKTDKSYAAIFLWDGSIFRITPWTRLRLNKIVKNLNNLTNSQTQIQLEQWDLWFHIIKLIKNSNNMQIQTNTWQMLIIRWTAWLVSNYNQKTYAVDYTHYIEVKNPIKSAILKEWQWAIITNKEIKIVDNFKKILNQIWINENLINNFTKLDKKYFEKYKREIIEYIKKQLGNNLILKIEELKLKIFSIWDQNYKNLLNKLQAYQYLLWETKNIPNYLINNPDLAFIASNLQQQKVKLLYLYNKLKNNFENSDLYKTYLINLKISWKINNISEQAIQKAIEWKKYLENLLKLNENNK